MANENDDIGLELSSVSMFTNNKPSNTSDPFFASAWPPIVSQRDSSMASHTESQTTQSHTEFPKSHYHLLMHNQGMAQYQSDPSFVQLMPKHTGSGVGNLSEMVGPFSLPQCSQDCDLNSEGSNLDEHRVSEGGVVATLPNGKILKRAAESISPLRSYKNPDEEHLKDQSSERCDVPKQQDGKKAKIEHNTRGKQAAKQDKESSQSGEDPKDNYIHVRARRGQTTNSHSLAERVRREKISERMRLLQELVPGFNKITGKTIMLDAIINYVQSLQQQVEFLSMKLATVNPELNLDLERILSKDIIQSRGGSAAVVGFGLGTNSSHAFSSGIFPGTISGIPSTNPQFPSLPQTVLDNEMQNLFQMGFGTKW